MPRAPAAASTSRSSGPLNWRAALYHGVCQRDWFHARSRRYASTLDAALHGNNIPRSVVDTLIAGTRAGVEPLRRYHRLRKRVLGLERYFLAAGSTAIVFFILRFVNIFEVKVLKPDEKKDNV